MTSIICKKLTALSLAASLVFALAGCSQLSERERSTAIGAGVGAVSGAVLSDGSGAGTLVGAAVGGLVGNQLGKEKK